MPLLAFVDVRLAVRLRSPMTGEWTREMRLAAFYSEEMLCLGMLLNRDSNTEKDMYIGTEPSMLLCAVDIGSRKLENGCVVSVVWGVLSSLCSFPDEVEKCDEWYFFVRKSLCCVHEGVSVLLLVLPRSAARTSCCEQRLYQRENTEILPFFAGML